LHAPQQRCFAATSDERRATSDERRATSDERRATTDASDVGERLKCGIGERRIELVVVVGKQRPTT